MANQWDEQLTCRHCNNAGIAKLSQLKGARVPTIHMVPPGFKAVLTEFGPDFHCSTCNVPAMP